MFILSGVSGQATYENVVLDFLFYSLFTPVCATMMNRIMFASEQLMAAKSAVSRVDEILQEKPLMEPEHPMIPADASIVFSDVSFSSSPDFMMFSQVPLRLEAWMSAILKNEN